MFGKYDIFISYRREGGFETAKHLNDLLVRDGYKVSFDIDTLRSGNFDTQILERIDQCKDFILIVDQHAFDRTLNPNFDSKKDWLRCELAYALKKNKNIIPIFLSGVTDFPNNLPDDIVGVTLKNGPEFNRYHFNSFYDILKKRFLHRKTNWIKIFTFILILISLITFCYLFWKGNHKLHNIDDNLNGDTLVRLVDTSINTDISVHPTPLSQNNMQEETSREEALKSFCGSFSIIAPGAMKDAITWVYSLELDPINSDCEWIEEGIVYITNSKGWCGTLLKMTEAWEIYNFSLHNSLNYAIADMRQVDEFYTGETRLCKVKLELDEYNNIKMSFIEGNDAPAPLCDSNGGYTYIATFYRE